MLLLKACKRCQGDLYVELHSGDASEVVCLQCGRRRTLRNTLRTATAA